MAEHYGNNAYREEDNTRVYNRSLKIYWTHLYITDGCFTGIESGSPTHDTIKGFPWNWYIKGKLITLEFRHKICKSQVYCPVTTVSQWQRERYPGTRIFCGNVGNALAQTICFNHDSSWYIMIDHDKSASNWERYKRFWFQGIHPSGEEAKLIHALRYITRRTSYQKTKDFKEYIPPPLKVVFL